MITKDKLKLFYPQLSKKDIDDCYKYGKPSRGPIMYPQLEQIHKVLPVDPVTGRADSFIVRFFRSLSAEEREYIGQFIKTITPLPNYKVSDEDLLNLTPSRYLQDATELQAYKDAMAKIVMSEYERSRSAAAASEPGTTVSSVEPGTTVSSVEPGVSSVV